MIASLAAGEWLRPREEVQLASQSQAEASVPESFGSWRMVDAGGVIMPRDEAGVGESLYKSQLARVYRNGSGDQIMLLIAYGGTQSDLLQLHRPESCYPAVGFHVSASRDTDISFAGASLPAVALTASRGERVEDIIYWTRMGEYFPRSAMEQRKARLKTALEGKIADGVLVRASIVRASEASPRHDLLKAFLSDFVSALPAKDVAGFIGTQRAGQIGH